MKLLTINTHSIIEKNYEQKLYDFVESIVNIEPDIIAMQEVNQSCIAPNFNKDKLIGMFPCKTNITIHSDNHVANVAQMLHKRGINYHWTWLPVKLGYEKYDEGLAILSKLPIIETDSFLISSCQDYNNWKTRKALGIKTASNKWFYTVHMGWWNDKEEPFKYQWEKLNEHLKNRGLVLLMGDFNSRADVRNEGYDCVLNSGWFDTYTQAQTKDNGFTVEEAIDGWKDNNDTKQMRIDYILSNQKTAINSSKVIFNGVNEKIVSDHYGIIIDCDN